MGVAKVTGCAFLLVNHNWVVAVWVHRQHVSWTELNANRATFTPGCKNLHLAARSLFGGLCRGLVFSRDKFGHDNPFCLILLFI
jgi:hypothetical protein